MKFPTAVHVIGSATPGGMNAPELTLFENCAMAKTLRAQIDEFWCVCRNSAYSGAGVN